MALEAVPEGDWLCPNCSAKDEKDNGDGLTARQKILKQTDCGRCGNCLDKPKFGGQGERPKK